MALDSMEEKAAQKGANAVIGVRLAYQNLGGTMGNTIMVTVFGTAVSFQGLVVDIHSRGWELACIYGELSDRKSGPLGLFL